MLLTVGHSLDMVPEGRIGVNLWPRTRVPSPCLPKGRLRERHSSYFSVAAVCTCTLLRPIFSKIWKTKFYIAALFIIYTLVAFLIFFSVL